MDKKTPLYDTHTELQGKMVSFGGFSMPVQYKSGLVAEHLAVRNAVGIFDVSHMGEIVMEGPRALDFIQHIFSNDFQKMKEGQIRYTLMCNEEGGIIDDLILYKYHDQKFMAVVNASNKEKDLAHMEEQVFDGVTVSDASDQMALIAVQGPKATPLLKQCVSQNALPEKYYTFKDNLDFKGKKVLISQTGYTGEEGYEIYCRPEDVVFIWQEIMRIGEDFDLLPCGLGARDTLRLEAGMPLYGHEMTESISPYQVGLDFVVKDQKDDFIGKKALVKDTPFIRVGFEVTSKGIAREGALVYVGGEEVGVVTSGTYSPYSETAIGMAFVPREYASLGTELELLVRKKKVTAKVVSLPFYQKK